MRNLILFILVLSGSLVNAQFYSDSAYKDVTAYVELENAITDTGSVKKLILKRKKYTSIPKEVFNMVEFEYLDLSKNKIDSISPKIGGLKNLEVLILSRNKFTKLPPELYELENLKVLNLSANNLDSLPSNIDKLKEIEELNLWNSGVSKLPTGIEHIKTLKLVDMRGVLLNYSEQEELFDLLPNVKLYLSPPCNCGF